MLAFDQPEPIRHEEGMTRRSRFKAATPTTALFMTKMRYDILGLLYQFKALRSHHITMHLPTTWHSSVVRSLRELFDHGLVDRVSDVRRFRALSQHDTYTLTKKGLERLSGRNIPYRFVPPDLGFTMNKEWDHSLMIVDLLSNLKAGADQAGLRLIPAEEIAAASTVDKPFIFPRRTNYRGKARFMKPDGVVGIEYPDGKRAYFAIEAEHNKPHERTGEGRSTKQKFEYYRDIDWPTVYDNLGIRNMRVLVVAPTPTEITNKFRVGAKVTPQSHLFLGHWLPVVTDIDVPVLPNLINAPWLRIGLPEEHINVSTLRS